MAKTKNDIQQELDALRQENLRLAEENRKLRQSNDMFIDVIKDCHNDISNQINVLTTLKKEMLSYEVQLDSVTAENVALKARMGRIEGNPIGKVALQTYRNIRDLKADIVMKSQRSSETASKDKTVSAHEAKRQIVQTLETNPMGKAALKIYRSAKSIAKKGAK